MSAARPLRRLSADLSPCLRTGECLAKRPGMRAWPWWWGRAKGARE